MSDDLEARGHHAITHEGETYIKLADASVTFSLYRKDIAAKDAEIARLRDACDNYFKTISLSQMRHGRILVGLERRIARQRRALAKLYKRRHDKNAALATARRKGVEEAAKIAADFETTAYQHGNLPDDDPYECVAQAAREIAAAIRAAALEGE